MHTAARATRIFSPLLPHRCDVELWNSLTEKVKSQAIPSSTQDSSDLREDGHAQAQMELVLQHLVEYTPHSEPFLAPVSQDEAPDYYAVVLRPMDLVCA